MIATNNLPSAGSAQIDKDFDKIRILDVSYPAVGGKEYSITPAVLGSLLPAGGNTPSGINLGTGASLYRETTAGSMQFKTLLQGAGINFTIGASTITIEASAGGGGGSGAASGTNLGLGASIYKETTAGSMQFRTLLAGAGVNLSIDGSTISIEASAGGTSGSNASGINLGAGASLYRETTAGLMQFKTLLPGAGVNFSADASTITVTASAGGTGNGGGGTDILMVQIFT